jgi:ABC-2 type transport system ATP-binding protein
MEAKDQLVEEHGIVTLSKEQLNEIDPKAIVGVREHRFGVEALVKRNLIPKSFEAEKITIEDIMVYMIKGEQK